MALTGDVDCTCGGKYVRFENVLTQAAKLLCAYSNRHYRYLLKLYGCAVSIS